ncbi:TatD family hydrolase [Clostridium sp. YIM B02515]|uniref:TatD family hydrolase n=1 Tax=Clostridium rhizosphaerae TaxID=2803861 RepID=A0ABS1TGT9_9CLOT|nr:TatD family hydrolase [Clostridium rhizosphaerae]MBL4938598.1 TatD family hydrolase [Clostridium rhizosphaerae]
MYIDAHNHLDFYGKNLDKALNIIKQNNIITLGCAMDVQTYLFTKEINKDNPLIIPCFGIHPWKADENFMNLDSFEQYIKESKVIGEIGLDYHWVLEKEKYPYMRQVFSYFLKMAYKYNKITNIHTKGAEEEIYESIKKYELKTPIIHWYSGPLDTMKKLLDYGCYFTTSVDIGYSKLTEEIVKTLPLNRILTETDGPTSLEWVNGQYGYPDEVKNIVNQIAIIKNLPYEEVKHTIAENFKKAGECNEYS